MSVELLGWLGIVASRTITASIGTSIAEAASVATAVPRSVAAAEAALSLLSVAELALLADWRQLALT
jgi:hypothetical protein